VPVQFSHGSKRRLSPRDLGRFPGESLFERVARAVCRADCLPRKELYESWEVARRVRRRARGGRVVEVASGHALLAHLMLILDDTSPVAIAIDPHTPPSAHKLAAELVNAWPRLAGRVTFAGETLADIALTSEDVVVSAHACGELTDHVLAAAIAARAPVAVLPCCHVVGPSPLSGWLDGPLAIDVARAQRLVDAGYAVSTQTIDPVITPKNRLLVGLPQ
jgi:hypothetical protein